MGKVPLLLLRLEGPLQSWGLRARWDVRDTGAEPSKSGIIGLLGCALGLGMQDPGLEVLDRELLLGMRVEQPGRRLVDYQTVLNPLPTAEGGIRVNPIISPRAYLQDASFLAVVYGPAGLLERCRAALESPRWPVYLGRKSCPPTRPVLEGLVTVYESVRDALEHHPWAGFGPSAERLRCVVESPVGRSLRADRMACNPARMYGSRSVEEFWVRFPGARAEQVGKEGDASCSFHG